MDGSESQLVSPQWAAIVSLSPRWHALTFSYIAVIMTFDPAAAGWEPKPEDDFPGVSGPIWERVEDGNRLFGFLADRRHVNIRGIVHGGMLVTLADHGLGRTVLAHVQPHGCATIQLNTHFMSSVSVGDFVELRPRIVRATRSVVFVHGVATVRGEPVSQSDGVWKILKST